jgi:hypothetical protein
MENLKSSLAAGTVPKSFAENSHKTLAYIRMSLESACLTVLQSIAIAKGIRDIGGSLTRNAWRGKALHICSPDVDSTDVQRKECSSFENSVFRHYGHECKQKNLLSNMTYVDFHMTQEQLVSSIGAPTFVITHDFASIADGKTRDWFKGECSVTVNESTVTMKTTGGTTYQHGYHKWEQDGVIVTKTGAVNYVRVFDEPATKSMILLLTPISGDYTMKDNTLVSTTTPAVFELTSGGEATRRDNDYCIQSGIFTHYVPVSTIHRVAFQMAGKVRDEKWKENLCSMLRGRFQMDKISLDCISDAADLTILVADRFAVATRDSYIYSPLGMNFIQKFIYRQLIPVLQASNLPYFGWALNMVSRWASSQKAPWLWNEITVHNYEICYPRLATTLLDTPHAPVEPFRAAGEDDSSPSVNEQRGSASEDSTESSSGHREETDGSSTVSTPSTTTSSINKERDDKTYVAPPLRSGAQSPNTGYSRGVPKATKRDVVRVDKGTTKGSHPVKGAGPNIAVGPSSNGVKLQGQHTNNKASGDLLHLKSSCKHPDHPTGPKCFRVSDRVQPCVTRQQIIESSTDQHLAKVFGANWRNFVNRPNNKRQNTGCQRKGVSNSAGKSVAGPNQPHTVQGVGKSVQGPQARGANPRPVRSDWRRNSKEGQSTKKFYKSRNLNNRNGPKKHQSEKR